MERLQKVIAQNTQYSRRAAEELIRDGKVQVNNKVVTTLGTKVNNLDDIQVMDNLIAKQQLVYYLLNKPPKTISSTSDEKNRSTVVDLIHERQKIYPIGRLDYDTTGLIILTNDGELANGLMHPKKKIPKTYVAKVKNKLNWQDIENLEKGIVIEGKKTAPSTIKVLKYNSKTEINIIEITIYEGRNHQVKKMFEAIGGFVIKLQRTHYAFLEIDHLKLGDYRDLKLKEIKKLYGLIK